MAFPLSFIFLITQILEKLTPLQIKMLWANFLSSPTPPLYAYAHMVFLIFK